MSQNVRPEVYALALKAAESLKLQLEERLMDKTSHGWKCNCGACGAGPSKVVGIHMPTTYQYQIAMWLLWTCKMKDNTGKGWSQGISRYIPWVELYPLFRNHFAGIEVQVEHPHAQLYYDMAHDSFGDQATMAGRKFVASGRTVVASNESAAFVRPIGDLTNSVWVTAEIRCDTGLKGRETKGALVGCNVDPFEFGQRNGPNVGNYYNVPDLSKLATFYVRIPGDGNGQDVYCPIARLVSRDDATGVATFELDSSVESFVSVCG